MFFVVTWGGAWSIVICTFLYVVFKIAGVSGGKDFWSAFFVIGPVEEAAKFLALLSAYFFIKKNLNEPTDGLIYMACVALGFSLIENYFYATRIPDAGYLIFLRLFISTPAHIYFSVFMGLSFYMIIKYRTGIVLLFVSYLYACFVHGLFNSILFHGWIIGFLVALMALSQKVLFSLLTYTTAISPFKISLREFVDSYGEPNNEKGLECLNCGSKNIKPTYEMGTFFFQKCDQCPCYVLTKDNIFQIFRYFGSSFDDLTNRYWDAKFYGRKYSTLYKDNFIKDEKGLGFFYLDELDSALDELNESIIRNIENKWWFPDKLKLNGATRDNKDKKIIIIPILISVFIAGVGLSVVDSMETRFAIIMMSLPLIIICYGLIYAIVSHFVETKKK